MHHRLIRRLLASLMLASIATFAIAGATFAHECFNDSRNANADANAANGNGWDWSSEILLQFVIPGDIFGTAPLTDEQLAEAMVTVNAQKASGDFDEIYALDRAMLVHSTAMQGKGVKPAKGDDDHAIEHATADTAEFGPLINQLVPIYMAVTTP
ncbi:MAG: hypothetical protein ACRDGD_06070 [Candidatus Limnocylindria bacterium]